MVYNEPFTHGETGMYDTPNKSRPYAAERTVALLAFEDVAASPVSDLMDIAQRQKTASELNAAILASQGQVLPLPSPCFSGAGGDTCTGFILSVSASEPTSL